jgi:hypothetical protein
MTLFSELRELGLVGFEIVDSRGVMRGANEFHVMLRATH